MTDIHFYHLTSVPLEKALPRLLEKVVASKTPALLQARDEPRVEMLNAALWTYTTKFFLPHGSARDGFSERQPIFLTHRAEDNPNQARILVLVDGVLRADLTPFERVIYMFDGTNPEALTAARAAWKAWKGDGHGLIYWQQDAKGAWAKKE